MIKRLKLELYAYLDAFNDESAPDGARFAMLEEAAERFFSERKIKADPNTWVHKWIQFKNQQKEK